MLGAMNDRVAATRRTSNEILRAQWKADYFDCLTENVCPAIVAVPVLFFGWPV